MVYVLAMMSINRVIVNYQSNALIGSVQIVGGWTPKLSAKPPRRSQDTFFWWSFSTTKRGHRVQWILQMSLYVFLQPYFTLLWLYHYKITITEVTIVVILVTTSKCQCN